MITGGGGSRSGSITIEGCLPGNNFANYLVKWPRNGPYCQKQTEQTFTLQLNIDYRH